MVFLVFGARLPCCSCSPILPSVNRGMYVFCSGVGSVVAERCFVLCFPHFLCRRAVFGGAVFRSQWFRCKILQNEYHVPNKYTNIVPWPVGMCITVSVLVRFFLHSHAFVCERIATIVFSHLNNMNTCT